MSMPRFGACFFCGRRRIPVVSASVLDVDAAGPCRHIGIAVNVPRRNHWQVSAFPSHLSNHPVVPANRVGVPLLSGSVQLVPPTNFRHSRWSNKRSQEWNAHPGSKHPDPSRPAHARQDKKSPRRKLRQLACPNTSNCFDQLSKLIPNGDVEQKPRVVRALSEATLGTHAAKVQVRKPSLFPLPQEQKSRHDNDAATLHRLAVASSSSHRIECYAICPMTW